MPIIDPATAGAALTGASNIFNTMYQGKLNVAQMAYNQLMYARQRKDALADWNMENEYNSPAAQMARLRAAGLNPNLVYGHGATAEGGKVRSADMKTWQPTAPQLDAGAAMNQFYDLRLRQAQMDNMELQRAIMEEEVKNKEVQRGLMAANTLYTASRRDLTDTQLQLKGVDLNYAVELKEMSLDAMRATVAKTIQDTQRSAAETKFKLAENERRAISVAQGVRESVQRIIKMRAETLRTEAQTSNEYFRKESLINQAIHLERVIEQDHIKKQLMSEELRLRSATPEYYEKKIGDIVESIISGATAPGTKFNPRQIDRNTKTEFQRIRVERQRGTW